MKSDQIESFIHCILFVDEDLFTVSKVVYSV